MKGGINFEEWKEIVKKNRRSLRSKSNSFKFEPESLTYGAEKAVKSPEYGQVHTITYNVTGNVDTTNWPTEIKSGKTLNLELILPYGASNIVDINADYTYNNGILEISNVQNNLSINIEIGEVAYENAKIGDYLYDDWTFGPTEKTGYLGRCIGLAEDNNGKSVWCSPRCSYGLKWSTEAIDTGLTNYSQNNAMDDLNGESNTAQLLSLGADKYPPIQFASEQFYGHGYLPAAGELYNNVENIFSLYGSDADTPFTWSSTESWKSGAIAFAVSLPIAINAFYSANKTSNFGYKAFAFIRLSGKPGKPVNNNGHEYVDLGLPSGTLWANMNVGASSETDYGNYYMYGMGAKTYDSTDTPYDGTEDPLDLSKDTARQTWGGDWHMPTQALMQELIDNTTYQCVTNYKGSGINGGTFTATNGAVLFLPAAGLWVSGSQYDVGYGGYYWGSSPDGSNNAYGLYFYGGSKGVGSDYRKSGYSVRPVIG